MAGQPRPGALVSKGAQWIDAASLDNAQGIVSGESDVTLSIVGKLDNGQGGLVSAQRALSFERDDTLLNNAGGRINGGSLLLKLTILYEIFDITKIIN
ncbi:putative hemagglutinin [Pseudomonas aeruginosa PA38182]|nr:putative hemagglutinin [Pseudomonas aeruginosa PA38182]